MRSAINFIARNLGFFVPFYKTIFKIANFVKGFDQICINRFIQKISIVCSGILISNIVKKFQTVRQRRMTAVMKETGRFKKKTPSIPYAFTVFSVMCYFIIYFISMLFFYILLKIVKCQFSQMVYANRMAKSVMCGSWV